MRLDRHLKILGIVTGVWAIFWLMGLPAYYRQYSVISMVVFDAVILVLLGLVSYWVLKGSPVRKRLRLSLWLAFYITVPLFIYDYLYCAVYLGYGLSFLYRCWYLSVYYLIPWLLCPGMALWLTRRAGTGKPMACSGGA